MNEMTLLKKGVHEYHYIDTRKLDLEDSYLSAVRDSFPTTYFTFKPIDERYSWRADYYYFLQLTDKTKGRYILKAEMFDPNNSIIWEDDDEHRWIHCFTYRDGFIKYSHSFIILGFIGLSLLHQDHYVLYFKQFLRFCLNNQTLVESIELDPHMDKDNHSLLSKAAILIGEYITQEMSKRYDYSSKNIETDEKSSIEYTYFIDTLEPLLYENYIIPLFYENMDQAKKELEDYYYD